MDVTEVACVCALTFSIRKKKKPKKYWVHPILNQRLLKRKFYTLYQDLRDHPKKFFAYYRMSKESFDVLLQSVGPLITFQDTSFRKCVSPPERLSVTLGLCRIFAKRGSYMEKMCILVHYTIPCLTSGDLKDESIEDDDQTLIQYKFDVDVPARGEKSDESFVICLTFAKLTEDAYT